MVDNNDLLREYQARLRVSSLEEAGELIELLKTVEINFARLMETKIGKTVRRIEKKYPTLRVRTKELIDKWKALLPSKGPAVARELNLDERREKCVALLEQVLGDREVALHIELTLYTQFYPLKYTQKARALRSNLAKNKQLRKQVLEGAISSEKLVDMGPREMATEENKQELERISQDAIDGRRSDWNVVNNGPKIGMYRCGKCNSERTTASQAQTRSADEPMTT